MYSLAIFVASSALATDMMLSQRLRVFVIVTCYPAYLNIFEQLCSGRWLRVHDQHGKVGAMSCFSCFRHPITLLGPYFVAFPNIAEARLSNIPIETRARACTILPTFVGYVLCLYPFLCNSDLRLSPTPHIVPGSRSIMESSMCPFTSRRKWLDISLESLHRLENDSLSGAICFLTFTVLL